MNPTDVVREMRKFVADRSLNERTTFLGGVVKDWADALEQSMREPVAWMADGEMVVREDWMELIGWNGAFVGTGRAIPDAWTPLLFTLPPDAAGEIERLKEAVQRLLSCPAIADEDFSDPEWGCAETREAEAFARAALAASRGTFWGPCKE